MLTSKKFEKLFKTREIGNIKEDGMKIDRHHISKNGR